MSFLWRWSDALEDSLPGTQNWREFSEHSNSRHIVDYMTFLVMIDRNRVAPMVLLLLAIGLT